VEADEPGRSMVERLWHRGEDPEAE